MTDQPELDEASSKQTVLGQAGANDSETTKSAIAAQIEQQAALDSIFHKENDGVQFGSMPLPALDTLDSLSQSGKDSSGAFKPIKPSASGSFSRIAPPAAASSKEASKEVLKSKEEKGSSPVSNARPIIIFDRVSKLYPAQPNRPALNNISMTISSGEFVFLVGHSGSGKSTFIRLINHEFTTSSGRLVVAGEDLSTIRRWRVPY
ncbi:MAG: ATP-binding cassette domain-containing protein, partial [Coriobacteriia bacterium]|nr:ATP-binding cassette domain-containing protein [Coriobacteriia bacterium]